MSVIRKIGNVNRVGLGAPGVNQLRNTKRTNTEVNVSKDISRKNSMEEINLQQTDGFCIIDQTEMKIEESPPQIVAKDQEKDFEPAIETRRLL